MPEPELTKSQRNNRAKKERKARRKLIHLSRGGKTWCGFDFVLGRYPVTYEIDVVTCGACLAALDAWEDD